jgi:hypothetical protein
MSLQHIEREFEARLEALDWDARRCAVFAYTEFTVHHLAGGDFAVVDRLNLHAGFWNTILGALQSSAFVALARIFEEDKSTYNAEHLLRFAEEMNGILSRQALEARKIRGGMSAEAAKEYAADAFELRPSGLSKVRAEFQTRRQFFLDKVAPIRHQVFAHAAKINKEERDALFTAVLMRPLEELVVFTLRLHGSLFQLYHNGREPLLEDAPSNIVDVIKNLPEKGTSTWEHLHAAKEAAALLEWAKAAPLEE